MVGLSKFGRGLDIYKKSKGESDPEDLDLRKCKKTTVDLFVIPKSSPLNNNKLCVTVNESSSQPNNTEATRTVKESSTQTEMEESKPLNNKEQSPKVQNQDTQIVKKQL